ncbi:MAG: leucyl/phenylalanyl-tRNA--protein transferase [Desulfamplus sp.]|nr:leucyl/phenylalanyl-tRNA--protein transferase [Desulfamplus sp.]
MATSNQTYSPIEFPPVHLAPKDGLLCFGGDLKPQTLINAYQNGIFPWFSEGEPILWWSPDPRLVLYPDEIHISKSLNKRIKRADFTVTMDRAFEDVIVACSKIRGKRRRATWLVDEMVYAYIELHKLGYAHSVESWHDGKLAGGLYGVSLGRIFFGESMFSFSTDASKVALAALCLHLQSLDFDLIDCQATSDHLISMGAREIARDSFLKTLKSSLQYSDITGLWDFKGF